MPQVSWEEATVEGMLSAAALVWAAEAVEAMAEAAVEAVEAMAEAEAEAGVVAAGEATVDTVTARREEVPVAAAAPVPAGAESLTAVASLAVGRVVTARLVPAPATMSQVAEESVATVLLATEKRVAVQAEPPAGPTVG